MDAAGKVCMVFLSSACALLGVASAPRASAAGPCAPGFTYFGDEASGTFCCQGTVSAGTCSTTQFCALDPDHANGKPPCPPPDACDGKGQMYGVLVGGFCCGGTLNVAAQSCSNDICALDAARAQSQPLCCEPGLINYGSWAGGFCCDGALGPNDTCIGEICALDPSRPQGKAICDNVPVPPVGGAMTSVAWLSASVFKTAAEWFLASLADRVWLADINGDGRDDVVGLDNSGGVWWSRARAGAGFAASANIASGLPFTVAAHYLDVTENRRLWLTDVTGDHKADFIAVAPDGHIWVAESTGAGFASAHDAGESPFTKANHYFDVADWDKVVLADMTADGKLDVVGFDGDTGRVDVATNTGTAAQANFSWSSSSPWLASANDLRSAQFSTTYEPRVWVADFNGDRRADVAAMDLDGGVWVRTNDGQGHLTAPSDTVQTPMKTSNDWAWLATGANDTRTTRQGWYTSHRPSRNFVADVNGDGKMDIVGIGTLAMRGNGDILALMGGGTPSTVQFAQKVLLAESAFTGEAYFTAGSRPRVFVADVTGDGRADVVGIAGNGDVWVARSASDEATLAADGDPRDFMLPAVKTGTGKLGGLLAADAPTRVMLGDVTTDGAKDFVAVTPAGNGQGDGDLLWQMAAPARVASITPVTRQMLKSGTTQTIDVTLTRSLGTSTFDKAALLVRQDGDTILPTSVTLDPATPRKASFGVKFKTTLGAVTRIDLRVAPRAMDSWGHALDGDGDGAAGGVGTRSRWWAAGLVAGAARADLYPTNTSDIPTSAGFGFEATGRPSNVASPANNPAARVVVLAGGGACDSSHPCFAGQTCVENMCQDAPGVDANAPLVLAVVDLIGVNTTRIAELVAARYGIPKDHVIVAATHAHAVFRTIRLFTMPYLDDRQSGTPAYEPWIEDRLVAAVGRALQDMTPVQIGRATANDLANSFERRFDRTSDEPFAEAKVMTAVLLQTPAAGGQPARRRAMLVSYADHPVLVGGMLGIDADYPGYMRQNLEGSGCSASDSGCVAMWLQGGAGDINPRTTQGPCPNLQTPLTSENLACLYSSQAADGRATGKVFSDKFDALSLPMAGTDWAQIRVRQGLTSRQGKSACNACTDQQYRVEIATAWWSAITNAVSIGTPATTLLRFGTLPGEAYSGLQKQLVEGWPSGEVPPILLAYTNGYLGYLPDTSQVQAGYGWHYAMDQCGGIGDQTGGPTFFASMGLGAPTFGEAMVSWLRNALGAIRN